jgi:hypothetical protein
VTPPVHFLHISKTGGSAIREALLPLARRHGLVLHGHMKFLRDIPEGERAFFFVRDPVSRFVSAFNSRLRMGRPKYDNPWLETEKVFFAAFPTANALAEALAGDDPERRHLAREAMSGIPHVNMPQLWWLDSPEYLAQRRASIAFVGFQERLTEDFERLTRVLGLPPELALPTDPVLAHATPPGFDTTLGEAGRGAIEAWYARDLAIVAYLRRHHAPPGG